MKIKSQFQFCDFFHYYLSRGSVFNLAHRNYTWWHPLMIVIVIGITIWTSSRPWVKHLFFYYTAPQFRRILTWHSFNQFETLSVWKSVFVNGKGWMICCGHLRINFGFIQRMDSFSPIVPFTNHPTRWGWEGWYGMTSKDRYNFFKACDIFPRICSHCAEEFLGNIFDFLSMKGRIVHCNQWKDTQ